MEGLVHFLQNHKVLYLTENPPPNGWTFGVVPPNSSYMEAIVNPCPDCRGGVLFISYLK